MLSKRNLMIVVLVMVVLALVFRNQRARMLLTGS
jgi:hypothetical protein